MSLQVTSMLSAGYLEPVNNFKNLSQINESDESKQQQEQKILSEEQAIKAKLGSAAEVQTTYHYALGTDGRRYITGASVTMKGTEAELNRVGGGITVQDLQSKIKELEQEREDERNLIEQAQKAHNNKIRDNDELSEEEEAQVRELESAQREVVAHEHAHQASAGEFGGGISYTYTQGPDGKNYITGGEVPIHLRAGSTPEETLENMQKVRSAATAPNDPSSQDMKVAAKASAMAMQARQEISNDNDDPEESKNNFSAKIIQGTPVIDPAGNVDDSRDPNKNGAASVLASVRAYQIQSQAFINPAA